LGTLARVTPVPAVLSERLELVSMSPELIGALLRGDLEAARREIGVELPAGFADDDEFVLRLRLGQMETDPAARPWLLRVMVTREEPRRAVGRIGFHEPPDEECRVEIGYTVFPADRGQGFATEACRALFGWAHAEHGVARFRASVSPANAASLAVVRKLGFRQTGRQWDERDGEELVFERDA
jgi:ribosomal-protein-alanine N-acetyltransferase